MSFFHLISLSFISSALAYSIPRDVFQKVDSSGSGTIQSIMNKTMAAMGGSATIENMHTMSYQAER
jgi:hypothetical protein